MSGPDEPWTRCCVYRLWASEGPLGNHEVTGRLYSLLRHLGPASAETAAGASGERPPSPPVARIGVLWFADHVVVTPRERRERRRHGHGRSVGWALVVRCLTWALLLLAMVVTASRWIDVAFSPLVLVQSLSPLAAAMALGGLGGVLVAGRRVARVTLAALCLLVLAVHGAIWLPWLTDESPGSGTRLTVMTASLLHGRADMARISQEIRAQGVDVLVMTEVRRATESRLRAAGVYDLLPHAVPRTPTGAGTVIRSRLRLTPLPAAGGPIGTSPRNPAATMRLGQDLTVRGVHPAPPVDSRVRQWRTNLDNLTAWARDATGPVIMAGDFNASVDHPGMRELLETGLRDAHEVAGAGRPPTWPRGRSVPPFVHIDHVLVRGVDVDSAEEVRVPGTDHVAVLVHLVVPAR